MKYENFKSILSCLWNILYLFSILHKNNPIELNLD